MNECNVELSLISPEMTAFCDTNGIRFEDMLTAGTFPETCPYDCAHTWYDFSQECGEQMSIEHPTLSKFTRLCTTKHESMVAIDPVDGNLGENERDEHPVAAQQGVVYDFTQTPGEGLGRSELSITADQDLLADRLDLSTQGAEAKHIEWDASDSEIVEIGVTALEGHGSYHLEGEIIGTVRRPMHACNFLQFASHGFNDRAASFRPNDCRPR